VLGASCEAGDITLEGRTNVSVLPSSVRLPVGDTLRIRATSNGGLCNCLWTSSNEARATVDATGLVRALAQGTVTVTATIRSDPNVKSSALVEVTPP
jgi:lactocepin